MNFKKEKKKNKLKNVSIYRQKYSQRKNYEATLKRIEVSRWRPDARDPHL